MSDIGYQDGIEAFEQWFRKLAVAIDAHNDWVAEFKAWDALPDDIKKLSDVPIPRTLPKIPLEGPKFDENVQTTWPWPKKFFDNTMRKLKDDHDAANPNEPEDPPDPDPTPKPEPWDSGYAPQAYNQGSRGQNARYNIRINCTQRADGKFVDKRGIVYNDAGLCDGGRTELPIIGLKPADEMDGKEPWESYVYMNQQIGPNKENYPPESYSQ